MNTIYIFDCDGTLTPKRQPMVQEFAEKFEEWSETHDFSIISGSDLAKIQEQIPEQILINASNIFTCSGCETWRYERDSSPLGPYVSYNSFVPKLIQSSDFIPSVELIEYLNHELKWCSYSGPKFPPHFEQRTGLLNFSCIGRGANQEARDGYELWSNKDGERHRIVNGINERFPDLFASIGGAVSIDIVQKGNDKSQVIDFLDLSDKQVVFYGDACHQNGNDYKLYKRILEESLGYAYNISGYQEFDKILFTNKETI